MKIYVQDHLHYGCIVVVANSEDEAREMMAEHHNYDWRGVVTEHDLVHGFNHSNYGDM